jgi:hypothetical protein
MKPSDPKKLHEQLLRDLADLKLSRIAATYKEGSSAEFVGTCRKSTGCLFSCFRGKGGLPTIDSVVERPNTNNLLRAPSVAYARGILSLRNMRRGNPYFSVSQKISGDGRR